MNIIIATLLAFSAYFVMVPNNVNFADPKAKVIEGFASSLFSYEGMFTGLIVGMLAVALSRHLAVPNSRSKCPAASHKMFLIHFLP